MGHDPRYALLIEWSDEDDAYIASFPEWEEQHDLIGHTHGATYEEAARKGAAVLDLLVRSANADGDPLPVPRRFDRHPTFATAR